MKRFGFGVSLAALAVAAFGAPALAQENNAAGQQAQTLRTFDVPAGDLASALREFGEQADTNVVFDANATSGKRSPGIQGQMTEQQALDALLAGSGLRFEQTTSGGYAVQDPNSPTRRGDADGAPPSDFMDDGATAEILVLGRRSLNADIRRSEDDAQPYVVFEAEDIERASSLNAEDFLRTRLPMNTQRDAADVIVDSNSLTNPAASRINLRGLGSNQTLILVDGRRVPGTGFDAGEARSFGQPNVNGIPLSAIERIEVLPSTAGGIYGGGATGGVINIVLKRHYAGGEIRANYGATFDGLAGRSDLSASYGATVEEGRTRFMVSYMHSEAEPLRAVDRDFARESRELLLRNQPSAFLPSGFFGGPGPSYGATSNYCAAELFFGILPFCNGISLVLDNGTPLDAAFGHVPTGYPGFVAAGDGGQAFLDTAGAYSLDTPNDGQSLLREPAIESVSLNIRREFGRSIEAYLDIAGDRNVQTYSQSRVFVNGYLPAADPANPFQQDIMVTYGTPGIEFATRGEIENVRVGGGIIARLPADWSLAGDYVWSRSDSHFDSAPVSLPNALNLAARADALQDQGAYPGNYAGIDFPAYGDSTGPLSSTLENLVVRASGPLLELPAGELQATAALEWRSEVSGERDARTFSPDPSRFSYEHYFEMSQSVHSAYLEARVPVVSAQMSLPFIHALDIQASVRHDAYETRGSSVVTRRSALDEPLPDPDYETNEVESTNYTLGIRYSPLEALTIRASHATGFLPPAIGQVDPISNSFPFYFIPFTVTDPLRGDTSLTGDAAGNIEVLTSGNGNLEPERSESWSAGFVWEPGFLSGFRVSVDYTHIDKTGEIYALQYADVVPNESQFPGRVTRAGLTPADEALGYTGGAITGLDLSPINLSASAVSAIDVQADYVFEVGEFGTVGAHAIVTHQTELERQLTPATEVYNLVGFNDGPLEWRANIGADWTFGPFSLGWNAQYYHEYSVRSGNPAGASGNPARVNRQGSETIPAQIYHDMFARVRLGSALSLPSLNGTELSVGVQNIFDESPPITAYNAEPLLVTGGYSAYGDPRLRRFTIALRHSF